ncbi:MAG: hypothetical protein RL013_2514 [Bacteroidota bacterium]|jgi:hypothetical protein
MPVSKPYLDYTYHHEKSPFFYPDAVISGFFSFLELDNPGDSN